MSLPTFKWAAAAVVCALPSLGLSYSVEVPIAPTSTCGQIGTIEIASGPPFMVAGSYRPGVEVVLEPGDVLSLSNVSIQTFGGPPLTNAPVIATLSAPDGKDRLSVPLSFTAVQSGMHYVGDLGLGLVVSGPPGGTMTKPEQSMPAAMPNGNPGEITGANIGSLAKPEPMGGPGAYPVMFPSRVTADVTCTPGGGQNLGGVSAFSQTSTIMSGLGALPGTPDGGGVQASRDSVFFTQGDAASGWRAWGYTDFRNYSENATGRSFGLAVGADRDVGAARMGVLLAYDVTTLDQGGGDESVRSMAIGPYVSGDSGSFSYDAFVTYSRPEYDLSGGAVTGKRLTYGLRGETAFDVSFGSVQPYLSINGSNEDLDGDTLTSISQSAGVRVDFTTFGEALPYISVAYTNNRTDSELTGSTEHQSLRYGFGISQMLDNGATLGLDVDSGEAIEGIRDVGLRISYSMQF